MYCYSNAYKNFFRTIFFNHKQIKTASQLWRGMQESVWKEAALNEHNITFLPPDGPLYNLLSLKTWYWNYNHLPRTFIAIAS